MLFRRICIIAILVMLWILSCERERFILDQPVQLRFSVDTVYFDTVFTQIGTMTKRFTVHNTYGNHIRISTIHLAGGGNSVFRMNVDGVPGILHQNVEIPPKDSLYIFVEATLDPNNSDNILLQEDSILFNTNNYRQSVNLAAWGQDVHMLKEELIETGTWINDKPYLVINYVYVDTLAVLNLDPGVRIYLHRDAVFYVGGTIRANGTLDEPVYFLSDRLEKMYEDIPGQWGGIYLLPGSRDNVFNHSVIRCGNFGIVVDTFMSKTTPALVIENSFIADHSSFGILARGSFVNASNTVIANCGTCAVALIWGGTYEFNHCTIANRWLYGGVRNTPAVFLNNYYIDVNKKPQIRDIHKAYFGNSIIHGNRQFELETDKHPDGLLNYTIDHCIGRLDSPDLDPDRLINVVINQDPKFISWDEYNFELDTLSPAKDIGSLLIGEGFPFDKNGNSRTADGKPDAGAYERIEAP